MHLQITEAFAKLLSNDRVVLQDVDLSQEKIIVYVSGIEMGIKIAPGEKDTKEDVITFFSQLTPCIGEGVNVLLRNHRYYIRTSKMTDTQFEVLVFEDVGKSEPVLIPPQEPVAETKPAPSSKDTSSPFRGCSWNKGPLKF